MIQSTTTQQSDTFGPRLYGQHSKRAGQPSSERATILIVDDEASIAELLAEVLDEAGYEVLTASDGRTGLTMSRLLHPTMVLTDYMMPELDGAQLVRELWRNPATHDIPAVLMSCSRPSGDELRGVPFLAKPFDLEDVLEIVARYLDSHNEMTPH